MKIANTIAPEGNLKLRRILSDVDRVASAFTKLAYSLTIDYDYKSDYAGMFDEVISQLKEYQAKGGTDAIADLIHELEKAKEEYLTLDSLDVSMQNMSETLRNAYGHAKAMLDEQKRCIPEAAHND